MFPFNGFSSFLLRRRTLRARGVPTLDTFTFEHCNESVTFAKLIRQQNLETVMSFFD